MHDITTYLVFSAQGQDFALPLALIERVLPAGPVEAWPGAPRAVLGVVTLQGRRLPVVSFARWLGCPAGPPAGRDQFIVAATAGRTVVLAVDTIAGLLNRPVAPGNTEDRAAVTLITDLVPLLTLTAGIADTDPPGAAPRRAAAAPGGREYGVATARSQVGTHERHHHAPGPGLAGTAGAGHLPNPKWPRS